MAMPAERLYTLDEYADIEDATEERNEYFRGRIYAMAGGSPEHGYIALNIGGELRTRLRGRGCKPGGSDIRIKIEETGLYTYPDLSVYCGEPRYSEGRPKALVNPVVLIEVLSGTTEAYDRGEKFAHYQRIPSLREYVLVSQGSPRVEWFSRSGDGGDWTYSEASGLDASLPLASVGIEVPLSEIYYEIAFPDPAPPAIDERFAHILRRE